MKKMRGILLIGIMLISMLGLSGCGKTTVNLDKYITISATGYDSMGTASYEFDYDAFEKDYSGKIKLNSKKDDELSGIGLLTGVTTEELLLETCVNKKLNKTTGLSNGDTVVLKWDCEDTMAEEYFNVTLKYSDIEYKVSDLEEVGKINPFDYVTVSFSGISPNGTVVITPNYDQAEIQYVTFTADKTGGLKPGDTVTVKANIAGSVEAFVEKFACVLDTTEKTYTVDALSRYISEVSDVSEELYNKMDKQLQDNFKAHVAQHWENKDAVQSFDNIGNYLVTLKDGMSGSPANYLYYVYKVTITVADGSDFTYYWYGYFTDVLILADGTCSVDLSSYTVSESANTWGYKSGDYLECYEGYFVAGFADLESFVNQHIISKIERYEYKQTIK